MASYHPLACLVLTFCLSAYFPNSIAQVESTGQPEVTILQGNLLGVTLTTRNNRSISAFKGIPYAEPPIGNLRFANPLPASKWDGTLNATSDSDKCPQIPSDEVLGEEDCLYLNVYTPQITNSSLLPVMVTIHGGAFKIGSQISTTLGPEYLLDEDVLLVAMNYRLGSLGFLSTGDEVAPGNWGLKDQVLALKWVQENIKYFGGDPDQVTIFGESAGSASVHLLALSNATIGLFHKYITQSGSALSKWAHRPSAAYSSRAFELGDYVGCSNQTSDSLITCLRTLDVSVIMAADSEFMVWESLPGIIWGPTDEPDIEGAILTDSPTNLFAAGKIRDLPWMSGVVRDEGLVYTVEYYEDEELLNDFVKNFDDLLPIIMDWIYDSDSEAAWLNTTKSYYFNDDLTANRSALLANLTMLVSDSLFFYPARDALEQHHAVAENPQYFYTFNYRGTYSVTDLSVGSGTNYGVAHSDDLIYLFPRELSFSHIEGDYSETDYEMVDTMVQLWTSFATNGTPTALALNGATWEPYNPAEDNYLRIGEESDPGLEIQYSFFKERMEFWAALYNTADEPEAVLESSGVAISPPNFVILSILVFSRFFVSVNIGSI